MNMLPAESLTAQSAAHTPVAELYLDVIKKILTRALIAPAYERHTLKPWRKSSALIYGPLNKLLSSRGLELVRLRRSDPQGYIESGHAANNRAEDAETMIGLKQLNNLEFCVTDVLRNQVPGDLIEAGVWRGGGAILMRAVLKAYAIDKRRVWVADSFAGLPELDDRVETFAWRRGDMAVSLPEVQKNFERYGLLDDQVVFLKGFFSDTLLKAPIESLAVLRVDADLYQSTKDVLVALYPKLSLGGYAIFDDYVNLPDCRRAIDEYRAAHGVEDEIRPIDLRAVFWQKTR